MMRLKTRISAMSLAFALLVMTTPPSKAMELFIIMSVNGAPISSADIVNRTRMLAIQFGQRDTPQFRAEVQDLAREQLIEEVIKLGEAERLGIEISQVRIDAAIERADIAQGRAPDFTINAMKRAQIPLETLYQKVESDISWSRVIGRRFRAVSAVSDQELDAEISRRDLSRGRDQRLVSEIFIGKREDPTEASKRFAEIKQALKNGVPFNAIAAKASEAVTRAAGGSLGWIDRGALPPNLEAALQSMRPGDISDVIITDEGGYLLRLEAVRLSQGSGLVREPNPTVTVSRLIIPVPQDAASDLIDRRRAKAENLRAQAGDCDALNALAPQSGSDLSGPIGAIKLNSAQANLRNVILDLGVNQPSDIQVLPSGFAIFMICSREEEEFTPETEDEKRDRIRDEIERKRLAIRDRQHYRNLRNDANIELLR